MHPFRCIPLDASLSDIFHLMHSLQMYPFNCSPSDASLADLFLIMHSLQMHPLRCTPPNAFLLADVGLHTHPLRPIHSDEILSRCILIIRPPNVEHGFANTLRWFQPLHRSSQMIHNKRDAFTYHRWGYSAVVVRVSGFACRVLKPPHPPAPHLSLRHLHLATNACVQADSTSTQSLNPRSRPRCAAQRCAALRVRV